MDKPPYTDRSCFEAINRLRQQVWDALQARDRQLMILHRDMLTLLSEIDQKHWTVDLKGHLLEEVPSDEPF